MPVKAKIFYRSEILGIIGSTPDFGQEPEHEPYADDHVQGVHAGHDKIEGKENFHLTLSDSGRQGIFVGKGGSRYQVMIVFVFVFNEFYTQKDKAKDHGCDHPIEGCLSSTQLSSPDGQSHGEAAGNKNDRIEATPEYGQMVATFDKSPGVEIAINGIGAEKAAEEQDFLGYKCPHAHI